VKYLQKMFSRHFYRSSLFWCVLLITGYTLGGFILLPKVINSQLVKQVKLNLGWQTEIGKVAFNPYTFTLVIDNVAIKNEQGENVISFQQYITDFELRSVMEGAFTFANVALQAPSINLVIDKNGLSNFQQALQTQAAKLPDTNSIEKTDSTLVKLLFDNITVDAGIINIVDHSQLDTIKYTVDPLKFNLKNFSTYANAKESGDYQLNIDLGNGQTIAWTGTLGIAPFRSTGVISIVGLETNKLWQYAAQEAPYNLLHGTVKVDANYHFGMNNDTPEFDLFDSSIELQGLQIALKQKPESFIDIKTASIGPVAFNLTKQTLQIDKLEIDAVDFQIERNKQGELTFLAPFAQHADPVEIESGSSESVADNQFTWSIGLIKVNNSEVNIIDKVPSVAAQIALHKINLQLSDLNQDMTHALPFLVSYHVDDSGENNIQGQVTPTPLNLNATLDLKDLALNALQPYISDLARVKLEQGKLSVAGAVSLALDAQGELHGDFEGDIHVVDFNTEDKILKQRLVGWEALSIDPIKVNFNPLSIAIDKIELLKPYSRMVITKERSVNFAQLLVEPKDPQQAVSEQDKSGDNQDEKPLTLTIAEITLTDGDANFADLSLIPAFATSIQNINGKISGLSANNLARADVNITGTVDEYGKMLVKGKINPLGGDLYTDINVKFDKIELATLTPYSGRYAGYVIDKGKMSLDLNYKIAQRQLIGSNRLILDQFELGTSVDSPEALNLPIKLAIALFKDRNGIIDISLPTQGDLDSPDFDIGGLVLKAFLNVMTKAVTSPFSMIANLAGTTDQHLNSVAFDFGSNSLTTTQQDALTALADILINRPRLILEIHAAVDKEKDGFALQEQQLAEQLTLTDQNQKDRIESMEELLSSLGEDDTVDKIKAQWLEQQVNSTPEIALNGYEKNLYKALVESQPLSSLDLTKLAKQRISIIQEQLIKNNNVPENQVFVVRPSFGEHAQEDKVLTVFSLNTH
jgi:hypothetical protein